MSISLSTVRFVTHINIDEADWSSDPRVYGFIEIISVGWTTGNRWRTRKFSTFPSVFAYLNKVNAGGWMDDDSYDAAWTKVLRLQDELFTKHFWAVAGVENINVFGGFFDASGLKGKMLTLREAIDLVGRPIC